MINVWSDPVEAEDSMKEKISNVSREIETLSKNWKGMLEIKNTERNAEYPSWAHQTWHSQGKKQWAWR